MDIDRSHEKLLRDETLIRRRPWYLLSASLFVVSALTRQPIALLAAFFILVIGIVPELWYRLAFRHLLIRQSVSQPRAFFGEVLTLSLVVENQKLLPLPWVEIDDEVPEQLSYQGGPVSPSYKVNRSRLVQAFSLWSFQRVTRRYQVRCMARGVYTFGPAKVCSSDPFGWLVREEQITTSASLVVYPLVAPIETFGFAPWRPFGEQTAPQRLLEDPLRVAGIREYQQGDDPRRIHWKATARVGSLRSKIYEPSYRQHLLIFLDISTYLESWMGIDPEMQELTIATAASLALWGLDEGYAVGLVANSLLFPLTSDGLSESSEAEPSTAEEVARFLPRVRVPIGQSQGQRERLLLTCARLLPYLGTPIESLIEAERRILPMGTTVLLVSAASVVRETTLESLGALRRGGGAVHLVLTGNAECSCELAAYPFPIHRVGGREVWNELIKQVHGDKTGQSDERSGYTSVSLHLA
jgi:uncharacterized protein (DUF58 family)